MLQPEALTMEEILDVPNMVVQWVVEVQEKESCIRNRQRLASEG